MDFLDPKKQRRHTVLLYTGYILIAIAVIISTVVLVYQANGFGVNSQGQIVQNGLIFFSSQPNPATITLNGQLNKSQTNSRISVPAGQYNVVLHRDGYRDWQRQISVQGGDVQHFDYPLLFPTKLTTKSLGSSYPSAPGIATQSRDQRWLLIQHPDNEAVFDEYDLKNPTQAAVQLTIPSDIAGTANGTQNWQVVQWADDNQHVLLQHTIDGTPHFVLLDRTDPTKSLDLNNTLSASPTTITLINNKYDQYYLWDSKSGDLTSANLKDTAPVKVLSDVINYKSYGDNTILYATADNAAAGKVNIDILDNTKTYVIRPVAANTTYLLDMTGYSGTPYVVIGAASENEAYIYRDPVGQMSDSSIKLPAAVRALKVTNPNYVSFSPNAQYIMVENGAQFGVYDIYLHHAYQYTVPKSFDSSQPHASWMDGNRLTYVSDGKLLAFDYDRSNQQLLMNANAGYVPFFSPDYHYVYAMANADNNAVDLTQTALLISSDL